MSKLLSLEEYNIREAKKALECDVFYRIYSVAYNKQINIYDNIDFLNKEDKNKVLIARENIEELKEIADGKRLSKVYTLYYYGSYLKTNK